MPDQHLRRSLIHLAHTRPDLRPHILPLLQRRRVATTVRVRRMMVVRVRVTRVRQAADGHITITGVIALTFGGQEILPFRFHATVADGEVLRFVPARSVSGAGAEHLTSVYTAAFLEAFESNPRAILGRFAA